jgi:hypothetical protein
VNAWAQCRWEMNPCRGAKLKTHADHVHAILGSRAAQACMYSMPQMKNHQYSEVHFMRGPLEHRCCSAAFQPGRGAPYAMPAM